MGALPHFQKRALACVIASCLLSTVLGTLILPHLTLMLAPCGRNPCWFHRKPEAQCDALSNECTNLILVSST